MVWPVAGSRGKTGIGIIAMATNSVPPRTIGSEGMSMKGDTHGLAVPWRTAAPCWKQNAGLGRW